MLICDSCHRCGLSASYPGAQVAEGGECRFCREAGTAAYPNLGEELLRETIARRAGSDRWACLVAYSGGKDSTYMLRRLAEWFPGRILAFTFDTQFMSSTAWENIAKAVDHLGVEWIKSSPDDGVMGQVFRRVLPRLVALRSSALFSRSTAEFGPLCWPCGTLCHLAMLRAARELGTSTVVLGFSPSQDTSHYPQARKACSDPSELFGTRHSPRADGMGAREYLAMSTLVFRLIEAEVGKAAVAPYRLDRDDPAYASMQLLRFYDYVHYNETAIRQSAAEIGFKVPADSGYGSTNCAINPLVRFIHQQLFGFDKYMAQDAALVRWGFGRKEEVASRVDPVPTREEIQSCCARLGMTVEDLEAVLASHPAPTAGR